LLGEETKGRELTRRTFETTFGVLEADKKWRQAVQSGFVEGSAAAFVSPSVKSFEMPAAEERALAPKVGNGSLELTFWASTHVYDGRFANNGWLQELPDFMTKLTWDNVALISPETARELEVKHQTIVTLKHEGQTLDIPA